MINFGIVGCSRIAAKHADAISIIEGTRLQAVCDLNKDRADDFAGAYSCKAYSDYKEMLQEADIDAVSICTPSGYHAVMGIEAACCKKHVLIEKPLALNLEDADNLINTCRENKVVLGVVHQNRFLKSVQMIKKAIEIGAFGKITHISAMVRWNRNDAYYREAKWRGSWELDGGVLLNQAIHNIDLLLWFLGPIESIFAHTATMVRKIEAPDIGVAILKAKSGAFGAIEAANTIYPANLEETLGVFGEKGTAVIGNTINRLKSWRFREDFVSEENAMIKEAEKDTGTGHFKLISDFAEAVRTGREPLVNGEEGRKAVELILAMYKSSETGSPVKLPLDSSYKPGSR